MADKGTASGSHRQNEVDVRVDGPPHSCGANRPRRERDVFGQPSGLVPLFGIELWERFSFYGMQGILLIYIYYAQSEGGLGLAEGAAVSIVGAYGGLIYLSTVLGGWVADRILGAERTLLYSGILVMIGHLALALIPGVAGLGVGLLCIGVGAGGVKATAASMVGDLYSKTDGRRDAGFSLFYMGINIGALAGPILTGLIQSEAGFHYGFGLAAVFMAVGIIQYVMLRKNLGGVGSQLQMPLGSSRIIRYCGIAGVGLLVISGAAITGVINVTNLSEVVALLAAAAAVGYISLMLCSRRVTRQERRQVIAFVPLFLVSAACAALVYQLFTVLTVYADMRLNRTLFNWEFPVAWIISMEAAWIITLAPVFTALWTKLQDSQPATPIKLSLAISIMGVAFLLFIPLAGGGENSVPLAPVILILALFASAELLFSPVMLSLATRMAPEAFHTQMVALNYLSIAIGIAVSSSVARYYDVDNEIPYFLTLGIIAIATGVILVSASRLLVRMMSETR